MNDKHTKLSRISPICEGPQDFTDAKAAVKAVQKLYDQATEFLQDHINRVMNGGPVEGHYRAYYPQISFGNHQ
jgi:AMP nucleosidase